MSDVIHSSIPNNPVKRASSLFISRRFSFRRSKLTSNDVWARGASEGGHTHVIDLHNTRPIHTNDATLQPQSSDPTNLPPQNKRAKFTIEPLHTSRAPPSAYHDLTSCLPQSPIDLNLPHIPHFRKPSGPQLPKRRWTLAMAITDEGITDEVLVEEFERLRMKQDVADRDQGLDWDFDQDWDVWEADTGASESCEDLVPGKDYSSPEALSKIPYTPSLPSFPTRNSLPPSKPATRSATTPSATWHAARRVLLTCRELVRTERHYLASLQSLLASETATTPPALMLRYVEELASVSQALLQQIQEDPSAWGVAAAFLAVEHTLESAFVGWCGVVGAWFEGQESTKKRKGSKTPGEEQVGDMVTTPRRSVSSWRISVPSMPSLNSITMTPMTSPVSPSAFLSRRREKAKDPARISPSPTTSEGGGMPKRRPSVRDLAILPTQRIMRYVLLYRELFDYMPSTSSSRALVGRVVDAACRIAQKCDRAQGNAAFLQKR